MKYIQSYNIFESLFIKGFKKEMRKLAKERSKLVKQFNNLRKEQIKLDKHWTSRFIPLLDGQEVSYKDSQYKRMRIGRIGFAKQVFRVGMSPFHILDSRGKRVWSLEYVEFDGGGKTYHLYANNVRKIYDRDSKTETIDSYSDNMKAKNLSIQNDRDELRTKIKLLDDDMMQEFVLVNEGDEVEAFANGKWVNGVFSHIKFKDVSKDFSKFKVEFHIRNDNYSSTNINAGAFIYEVSKIRFPYGDMIYQCDSEGNRTATPISKKDK